MSATARSLRPTTVPRYNTVRAFVAQVCADKKQEKPVQEAGTEKTDLDLIVNRKKMRSRAGQGPVTFYAAVRVLSGPASRLVNRPALADRLPDCLPVNK